MEMDMRKVEMVGNGGSAVYSRMGRDETEHVEMNITEAWRLKYLENQASTPFTSLLKVREAPCIAAISSSCNEEYTRDGLWINVVSQIQTDERDKSL